MGLKINNIHLDPASAKPTHEEGNVFYDKDEKALAVYNDEAGVTHQLGQEGYIRVYNNSGATIVNGKPVYLSGTEVVEDRATIALAIANTSATAQVIGFATHDIENNTFGYITEWGLINDLDTSAFASGNAIYLSDTVAGDLVTVAPETPSFVVRLGYIIKADVATGRVLVNINPELSGGAGDSSQTVVLAQKGSAGTINAGELVYLSGYDTGANVVEVELADANGAGTSPAFGVARTSFTQSSTGELVVAGKLINVIDTSAWAAGDALYMSDTAGLLTNVKPTGTSEVQKVAVVLRSHASQGSIEIFGAGRTNDLPNLPTDQMWLGDGSGVPAATNAAGIRTAINVADGATANDTDANLKARANHTGTQTASTISNFATMVGSSTATLTNKTFNANGTGNSITNIDVADLANGTDGELITWDAAGAPSTVPVGTATHVLTSNGAGAPPTFQASAGGSDTIVMSTSFFKNNSLERGTASATYTAVGRFRGLGSATHTLTKIVAISRVAAGTGGKVRVIDLTNGSSVIAELTGISTTSWSPQDLGTISNQAAADAAYEIQIGGDATNQHEITHITFEFSKV